MTNAERRTALNAARYNAYRHARNAEEEHNDVIRQPYIDLATMWATVAEAMKDGDPMHDGPDGAPTNGFAIPDGVHLTR